MTEQHQPDFMGISESSQENTSNPRTNRVAEKRR